MFLMSQNCTLENGENGKFYAIYFTTIGKEKVNVEKRREGLSWAKFG